MVPPAATVATASSRKRNNDTTPTTAKRSKKSRKIEEKENSSKPGSSTSSPALSTAGSTHEVSYPPPMNVVPKKREPTITFKTCRNPEELKKYYEINDEKLGRVFRLSNIIQKKKLISGKAICQDLQKPSLEDVVSSITKKTFENSDSHLLCQLNISRIQSWGNSLDFSNYASSFATVQSYTVIVDNDDKIRIIENGMSVISLTQKSLSDSPSSNEQKHIVLNRKEFNNAKKIYFTAVVRRQAVKEDRRGGTRKANRSSVVLSSESHVYEELIRCGSILVFDAEEGRHAFASGIQRMILVEKTESAAFEVIFQKLSECPTDWMKCSGNLDSVHQVNRNKQDQHLPRLIFNTASDNLDETLEILSTTPMNSPRSDEKVKQPEKLRNLTQMINEKVENFSELSLRYNSRFPCFKLEKDKNDNSKVIADEKYFEDDIVKIHGTSCCFRPVALRRIENVAGASVGIETSRDVLSFSPRNIGVGGKRKYGLDCVISKGHLPFLKTIYQQRDNSIVPLLDGQDSNSGAQGESYALSNPALYTEMALHNFKAVVIPKECQRNESEMSVLDVPLTKNQIDSFHKKLSMTNNKKSAKKEEVNQRKCDPSHFSQKTEIDLDNHQIPKFCEIFFPQDKMGIYNILCRYYYSASGHRPGSCTAEWKCRLLLGFVNSNYEHVFKHQLEDIFRKHVALLATIYPGWSKAYQQPLVKLRKLKKEWLKGQKLNQQAVGSS